MLALRSGVELHALAGELYARCWQQGVRSRNAHDCLFTTLFIERGVALLRDDRDFELIAIIEPNWTLYQE